MSGDPLRDLDCAGRIHVLGNTRRTEAVTTNSFLMSATVKPSRFLEPRTAPRICHQAGTWGMSNVLKVNLQETIHTLRDRGWSRRRIARELGIDRETVGCICVYQNQPFRPPALKTLAKDGLAGTSDDQQRLRLALALWNGRDPILKERLFGLTDSESNLGLPF
jgi:hypothetical protein